MDNLINTYNYITRLSELSNIPQIIFLFLSTIVSILIYLIKLGKGTLTDKQWEMFLLTTLLFIIIPESFYTFVWGFIFN